MNLMKRSFSVMLMLVLLVGYDRLRGGQRVNPVGRCGG